MPKGKTKTTVKVPNRKAQNNRYKKMIKQLEKKKNG